jgi:hypothetical protein
LFRILRFWPAHGRHRGHPHADREARVATGLSGHGASELKRSLVIQICHGRRKMCSSVNCKVGRADHLRPLCGFLG